jgi:drug/metabolite transporter (DMT)-like permease
MPYPGEFAALFTACLWSVSAFVFAAATRRAGSVQVNITRLMLATLFLLLLIAALRLDVRLSVGQVLCLALSGVVGLALGDTFLFKAFQEIGARRSMLVMSLAPAIAAVLAYAALGETLPLFGIIGIAVTVGGIGVVVVDRRTGGTREPTVAVRGLFYAFLGAAGQGGGLVLAKLAFREAPVNGFVAAAVRIIASLVILLPVALLTRRLRSPFRMFADDRKAFGLTALGSVLGPFLGISFSLIAVEYAKVGVAATIMAIVPILMLPIERHMYGERHGWRAVIGACIAVTGVGVLFLR